MAQVQDRFGLTRSLFENCRSQVPGNVDDMRGERNREVGG